MAKTKKTDQIGVILVLGHLVRTKTNVPKKVPLDLFNWFWVQNVVSWHRYLQLLMDKFGCENVAFPQVL